MKTFLVCCIMGSMFSMSFYEATHGSIKAGIAAVLLAIANGLLYLSA